MTYYGRLLEPGMTFEFDMSEYSARYSPTHVLGLHNEYIGEPITSYMRVSTGVEKIEYNTKKKNHNFTTLVENSLDWTDSYEGVDLKKASVSGLIKGV